MKYSMASRLGELAEDGEALAILREDFSLALGLIETGDAEFLAMTLDELLRKGLSQALKPMRRSSLDMTQGDVLGGLIQLSVKVAVIAAGALVFRRLTLIWFGWPLSFAAAGAYLFFRYQKKI